MEKIEIKTRDGIAECRVFYPVDNKEPLPAVIFFMDAYGLRPALDEMGQRFASAGYYVLVPDLYYRAGSFAPFSPATAFTDPQERERLMGIMKSIDIEKTMSDIKAFLDYLDTSPGVKPGKRGLVGYCMGGRIALTAAGTFPDRIAAIASIHGGGLVTENPGSPHLLVKNITAKVYIGGADEDKGFTPEHSAKLEQTFKDAGVNYELELYHGAHHGFTMSDSPVYDRNAAEHHYTKVLELFGEVLK